jgi:hypothetical protein
MTRYIAALLSLAVVGCTTTTPPPVAQQNEKQRRAKAQPNLDRTYDWGARPPTANPDRERD